MLNVIFPGDENLSFNFRPEEIRGGGLLRYCNLLVRDFTPGDIDECEAEGSNPTYSSHFDSSDILRSLPSNKSYPLTANGGRYLNDRIELSSRPEDVWRLEQLMCSRFFIDFNEFRRQQKKLLSYMESHFDGEDDLKFQYLLILRRVVDKGTICLMSHERCLIIDFITCLARESLAKNVAGSKNAMSNMQNDKKQGDSSYKKYENSKSPNPYSHTASPSYRGYHTSHGCNIQNENSNNNNNNNHDSYFPHYNPSATVKPNYAPQNIYPPPPHANVSPGYGLYPPQNDVLPPPSHYSTYQPYPQPCIYCPCCHAVYPPNSAQGFPSSTMSPTSPPFFPASKQMQVDVNVVQNPTNQSQPRHPMPANRHSTVFLTKDAKLYYNPAPIMQTQVMEDVQHNKSSQPDTVQQASVRSGS